MPNININECWIVRAMRKRGTEDRKQETEVRIQEDKKTVSDSAYVHKGIRRARPKAAVPFTIFLFIIFRFYSEKRRTMEVNGGLV